jgi:hypothetical protein
MRGASPTYRQRMNTPSRTSEALLLTPFLLGALATGAKAGPAAPKPDKELSKEETETLVRQALSARLAIAGDAVRVLGSESRTWPDRRLGCGGRRGLEEPVRVPGYRFVIEADGQRHTYHSDRSGRVLRCDAPPKPVGPITR